MIEKYFVPVFDPTRSIAAVASSKAKSDEIAEELQKAGFEVERRTLDVGDDEDDDEEDEDDEEDGEEDEDEEAEGQTKPKVSRDAADL